VPTYQYACTECGHAFEQFQSFSDDALTVCPECQGRLRKVFNAVGVVFKGSGFYRTDSRSSSSSSDASSTPAGAAKSSSDGGSPSAGSSSAAGSSAGSGSSSNGSSTSSKPAAAGAAS
jgi:putative FmdB family regulatory protein